MGCILISWHDFVMLLGYKAVQHLQIRPESSCRQAPHRERFYNESLMPDR